MLLLVLMSLALALRKCAYESAMLLSDRSWSSTGREDETTASADPASVAPHKSLDSSFFSDACDEDEDEEELDEVTGGGAEEEESTFGDGRSSPGEIISPHAAQAARSDLKNIQFQRFDDLAKKTVRESRGGEEEVNDRRTIAATRCYRYC